MIARQRFLYRILLVMFATGLAINSLSSQGPALSVYVGGGQWHTWVNENENAYTNDYKRWFPLARLGLELDFSPRSRAAFVATGGFEHTSFNYYWSSLNGSRAIANLDLFSANLSSGLRLEPFPNLQFRMALVLQVATGTTGTYTRSYYVNNGIWVDYVYANRFYRLRKLINVGFEWGLGWRFPLKGGFMLEPRFSSHINALRIFYLSAQTPHNPRSFRWSLELAFTFGNRHFTKVK